MDRVFFRARSPFTSKIVDAQIQLAYHHGPNVHLVVYFADNTHEDIGPFASIPEATEYAKKLGIRKKLWDH